MESHSRSTYDVRLLRPVLKGSTCSFVVFQLCDIGSGSSDEDACSKEGLSFIYHWTLRRIVSEGSFKPSIINSQDSGDVVYMPECPIYSVHAKDQYGRYYMQLF